MGLLARISTPLITGMAKGIEADLLALDEFCECG